MRRCRGLCGLVACALVFVTTLAMANCSREIPGRDAAEEGSAHVQYLMGIQYKMQYRRGRGACPQDAAEAAKWYRMAAEQGHADGRGVPQNDAEAVKWFRKAAMQPGLGGWWMNYHAGALYDLGRMYAKGRGVPEKDVVKASFLYVRAAEEGYVPAQFALSDMYANGEGVPQDNVQAYAWFLVAEARSFGFYRAQHENDRIRLVESMSHAEVAAAEGLAWCDYWDYRPLEEKRAELSRLALGMDDDRPTCRFVDGEWRVLPQRWLSR